MAKDFPFVVVAVGVWKAASDARSTMKAYSHDALVILKNFKWVLSVRVYTTFPYHRPLALHSCTRAHRWTHLISCASMLRWIDAHDLVVLENRISRIFDMCRLSTPHIILSMYEL